MNNLLKTIIRDVFIAALLAFIFLSVLELLRPTLVINFINLNYFFAVLLILGILNIFFPAEKDQSVSHLKFFNRILLLLIALGGAVMVFYLLKSILWLAVLLGFITLIFLYVSLTLLYKKEDI